MNVVRLPDRGRRAASDAATQADEAGRVRAWIERILATGDGAGHFSIERLCRKAGTSPTNITRFMKDGVSVPRLSTLARLAAAAGVPPPGLTMTTDPSALVDLPVISPLAFRKNGLQGATVASRTAVRAPAKYAHCVAVTITADTGTMAGVLLGDVVIVDPVATPGFNDLVVVALDTGGAGIYRVQGPFLFPQAAGNHAALPADASTIIGIARQVQRELGRIA